MQQVLAGVTVLEYAQYLAGPFCGTALAEMGANVIKIEPPGGFADRRTNGPFAPKGEGLMFLMSARNKKGITLDLEKPRGQELFRELVRKADVLLENVSPQAKRDLGFSYEDVCRINPGIILTDVSAFGTGEPYSSRLGFDISTQAESGIMAITGFPEGPGVRCAIGFVDMSTALYAAFGTAMALLHRMRTGEGQHVGAALMDTAIAYMGFQGTMAEYELLHQERPRMGNEGYHAFADTFQARDGQVIIAAPNDATWKRLVRIVGHPELRDDQRFASNEARWINREAAYPSVREWVAQRGRDEICDLLGQNGVPCGPVNSVAEAFNHSYVHARDLLPSLHIEGVGMVTHPRIPVHLSKTPGKINRVAPRVGQDNEEVYGGLLGLSLEQINALKSEGVI